jgi:hypothetical protein
MKKAPASRGFDDGMKPCSVGLAAATGGTDAGQRQTREGQRRGLGDVGRGASS